MVIEGGDPGTKSGLQAIRVFMAVSLAQIGENRVIPG
ncbi:hypothetical protein SAMN06265221_105187 [Paracoccus laeviglucosivorans]|uniref:Uncharacterized protein n=1 Tax=Paracoccus laeviglucosivorans TaxID=1197861 RepID=A0A521CUQ0_9RHOB|nr:hypothetical protein SAMN06265221_105187 [Paracoccus laeviglucosivorans]